MRAPICRRSIESITHLDSKDLHHDHRAAHRDPPAGHVPPLSRTVRIATGTSLILAGLLNGLSQYVGHLAAGDIGFEEYLRWSADNPGFVAVEQSAMVVSVLFAWRALAAAAVGAQALLVTAWVLVAGPAVSPGSGDPL